jgi:hypothetical protein
VLAADATIDPQLVAKVNDAVTKLDAPNFQEARGRALIAPGTR